MVLLVAVATILAEVRSPRSAAQPPPGTGAVPRSIVTPSSPVPTTSPRRPAPRATPRATGPRAASSLSNFWGIDVSWPQCEAGGLDDIPAGFVVVGINGGRPFTANPCLAEQVSLATSRSGYTAYLNLDAPRFGDPAAWGRRVALDGLARVRAAGLRPRVVWLDVEILNHWSKNLAANVRVIQAAGAALHARGVTAGVYSSQPMWRQITGDVDPGIPVWLATEVTDYRALSPWCATGLGGRPAVMAQYVATTGAQLIDVDVLCEQGRTDNVSLFTAGSGSG
jgi:hypothetical protein